jgi:hypothetical protein
MKTELEILKEVRDGFQFHSDHSTECNGYRSLCRQIERLASEPNPSTSRHQENDKQPESKAEVSAEDILQNRASLSIFEMYSMPNEKLVTVHECLEAMHEFASLREVKMPDRDIIFPSKYDYSHEVDFDYAISEIKRLNNLK